MSTKPSARAGQAPTEATPEQAAHFQAHQDEYDALPKIRAWAIRYVNFDDGPGGGFELIEMMVATDIVAAAAVKAWPPELMPITCGRLMQRMQQFAQDPDSPGGSY